MSDIYCDEHIKACLKACAGLNPNTLNAMARQRANERKAELHGEELGAVPELLTVLERLCAEVSGLKAFEIEIRNVAGNTNWCLLLDRLSEARAAIAKCKEDSHE